MNCVLLLFVVWASLCLPTPSRSHQPSSPKSIRPSYSELFPHEKSAFFSQDLSMVRAELQALAPRCENLSGPHYPSLSCFQETSKLLYRIQVKNLKADLPPILTQDKVKKLSEAFTVNKDSLNEINHRDLWGAYRFCQEFEVSKLPETRRVAVPDATQGRMNRFFNGQKYTYKDEATGAFHTYYGRSHYSHFCAAVSDKITLHPNLVKLSQTPFKIDKTKDQIDRYFNHLNIAERALFWLSEETRQDHNKGVVGAHELTQDGKTRDAVEKEIQGLMGSWHKALSDNIRAELQKTTDKQKKEALTKRLASLERLFQDVHDPKRRTFFEPAFDRKTGHLTIKATPLGEQLMFNHAFYRGLRTNNTAGEGFIGRFAPIDPVSSDLEGFFRMVDTGFVHGRDAGQVLKWVENHALVSDNSIFIKPAKYLVAGPWAAAEDLAKFGGEKVLEAATGSEAFASNVISLVDLATGDLVDLAESKINDKDKIRKERSQAELKEQEQKTRDALQVSRQAKEFALSKLQQKTPEASGPALAAIKKHNSPLELPPEYALVPKVETAPLPKATAPKKQTPPIDIAPNPSAHHSVEIAPSPTAPKPFSPPALAETRPEKVVPSPTETEHLKKLQTLKKQLENAKTKLTQLRNEASALAALEKKTSEKQEPVCTCPNNAMQVPMYYPNQSTPAYYSYLCGLFYYNQKGGMNWIVYANYGQGSHCLNYCNQLMRETTYQEKCMEIQKNNTKEKDLVEIRKKQKSKEREIENAQKELARLTSELEDLD